MNAARNPAPLSATDGKCAIQVYTLGRFSVVINGVSMYSSLKVQKKPLAILKLLIAFGGRQVASERICETLWRNVDGDYSQRAFKTTLYRLRKLLESKKALLCRGGEITLNPAHVSVDMWKLQRLLSQIERLIKDCATEPAEIQNLCEQAMRLYAGPFLANETGEWAIAPRNQLRRRFLRLLHDAGQALDDCGRTEVALVIHHKGLEINELAEISIRS
jgi:two-component SAPR family response regulator